MSRFNETNALTLIALALLLAGLLASYAGYESQREVDVIRGEQLMRGE